MKAQDLITLDEGRRNTLYKDSRGYWTIGIGRLIDPAMGARLSDDEVDYLFANDLKRMNGYCCVYHWYTSLDDVRQAAVLNMMFNLGPARFSGFHRFIDAMAIGNWAAAHDELLDSEAGRDLPGRYGRLAKMIVTGEWPA
jgi:lysozyme